MRRPFTTKCMSREIFTGGNTRSLRLRKQPIFGPHLLRYYGRLRVLRQYLPHILSTSHQRVIQWFVARGGYIFDYFQEVITAAQYALLGLKLQPTVGHLTMESFLDHEDTTKWELEAVEVIGTRATINLMGFIFENAWDHASHLILEELTPWVVLVEKDCLSIVQKAPAESRRVPTPGQHATQALVIYKTQE